VRVVQAEARHGAVAGDIAWNLSAPFADDAGEGGEQSQTVTQAIYDLRGKGEVKLFQL
jgi:hypothetical protein